MSRYRVSRLNSAGQEQFMFQVNGAIEDGLSLMVSLPETIIERLRSLTSEQVVSEVSDAIRLIADETAGGIILCSTGKKNRIVDVGVSESLPFIDLLLSYPEGAVRFNSGGSGSSRWIEYTISKYGITKHYTIRSSDSLTIEMDWGDEPSGLSGGDAAEQVKDFFGIVKDGDTVKVVTEDGGEEIVEPVGLMDEDDVYDYLEDIAVLMGGITAEQAASITAATRAIIHGGSGSGEGGEGGSGSGSGE